ncbi:MAG: hypothetical protein NTZ83_02485 [Candidatus Pacearchaeota archaeon]|nr:hypothetical protein [Candidatus Pacearchaeota archaeon]
MEDPRYANIPKELWDRLRPGFIEKDDFITAITSLPRSSHDLFPFVEYEGKKGILLIKRKIEPAKGMLWCLGGRQQRGYIMRDSLVNLIGGESHLELYDIVCLSNEPEDLFWDKDPFKHEKGVHDICTAYFARAKGELELDFRHRDSLIVTRPVLEEIKDNLHWYVRKYTEKALDIAFSKNLF